MKCSHTHTLHFTTCRGNSLERLRLASPRRHLRQHTGIITLKSVRERGPACGRDHYAFQQGLAGTKPAARRRDAGGKGDFVLSFTHERFQRIYGTGRPGPGPGSPPPPPPPSQPRQFARRPCCDLAQLETAGFKLALESGVTNLLLGHERRPQHARTTADRFIDFKISFAAAML